MFKTYALKHKEIEKKWFVIDAKDIVLGRLASQVAKMLMGKNKATYSPHLDCGDNVIITNAKEVALTGNKLDVNNGKKYYWHTGHPGGIKETSARNIKQGKHPSRIIVNAVKRMISRNKLGTTQMSHLYVYDGSEHPHAPQQPISVDMQALNSKNKR